MSKIKKLVRFTIVKNCIDKGKVKIGGIYLCKYLKSDVESYYEAHHLAQPMQSQAQENIYFTHYTSMEAIYSILLNYKKKQSGGLRLSDASYSNDPSEGDYLKKEIVKDHKWLSEAKKSTDAFVCSFISGDKDIGDKVTYWQAYGKDGLGCSIQLPPNFYAGVFDRVFYGKQETQKVKKWFTDYFDLGKKLYTKFHDEEDRREFVTSFWKAFDKIKYLYKHDGYEHEKEFRLIKISKKPKEKFVNENPYLQRYIVNDRLNTKSILASGSRVVIGPRVLNKARLRQYLAKLAKEGKIDGPKFIVSKIPYRKI